MVVVLCINCPRPSIDPVIKRITELISSVHPPLNKIILLIPLLPCFSPELKGVEVVGGGIHTSNRSVGWIIWAIVLINDMHLK